MKLTQFLPALAAWFMLFMSANAAPSRVVTIYPGTGVYIYEPVQLGPSDAAATQTGVSNLVTLVLIGDDATKSRPVAIAVTGKTDTDQQIDALVSLAGLVGRDTKWNGFMQGSFTVVLLYPNRVAQQNAKLRAAVAGMKDTIAQYPAWQGQRWDHVIEKAYEGAGVVYIKEGPHTVYVDNAAVY